MVTVLSLGSETGGGVILDRFSDPNCHGIATVSHRRGGGVQIAAEEGGSSNDCGDVQFCEERAFSVSADLDQEGE
jgi:hypothetical protein